MIKHDIAKLKAAIRENTQQLEKLTEQVKQISQATNLWDIPKSPETGALDGTPKMSELLSAVFDKAYKEETKTITKPKTVLFACVHNAGRSKMAEALFDQCADLTKASAISAGSQPASNVHPNVAEVMKEVGCYFTYDRPVLLTEELAAQADLFVSMGCGETGCPIIPAERLAWQIEDPKEQPIEKVRQIRNQIQEQVVQLLTQRGWLAERAEQAQWVKQLIEKSGAGLVEAPSKLIITPENIERLIIWAYDSHFNGDGLKIRRANMDNLLASCMSGQIPYEHQIAFIHFLAYSKEERKAMIEEILPAETPKNEMIVPENIKALVVWRYDNLPDSIRRMTVALANNALYALGQFGDLPPEHQVAYNQLQFYSVEDQYAMIQQVLDGIKQ